MTQKETIEEALENSNIAIFVDSSLRNVIVPEHLKGDICLILNVGYVMNIPDMAVEENGIRATLSFANIPFECFIPFRAIWGYGLIGDPQPTQIFEENLPDEILERVQEAQISFLEEREIGEKKKRRGGFTVIKGGKLN